MNPYIPILLMILAAAGISAVLIAFSSLIGPRKPNPVKQSTYECGMTPIGGARARFSVKFYLVAMLFILFDVEAIFFYPWAVIHRHLGWFGLIEMAIFTLVLVVGYIYIWKRGAFVWD
jgi:NADH-quinone oxidoreductase subunit A